MVFSMDCKERPRASIEFENNIWREHAKSIHYILHSPFASHRIRIMSSRIVFTPTEKQCLLDMINKYPGVASISTNHLQLREKKHAWAKLTDDFNSIAGNQKRTQQQLRKCWDNIKTKRKLELCAEKRSRLKTGGGRLSPTYSREHHPADSVLDLATNIEPIICNDSDGIFGHTQNDVSDIALLSTSSDEFSMPRTDQSMEVPVFNVTRTPKENTTPLPTRRKISKKDSIQSIGQLVRAEAKIRCLRNKKLIENDEEMHKVRMETAQEQLKSARLQTKLLELGVQKAEAELKVALAAAFKIKK